MIHLNDTRKVSEHVRNRSKRMWVRSLAPDVYAVKPKEKGKARRVVRLLQSSAGIYIECSEASTGKPCLANVTGKHCAHAEAALNRLLTTVKRQANKQLKEQRLCSENQAAS